MPLELYAALERRAALERAATASALQHLLIGVPEQRCRCGGMSTQRRAGASASRRASSNCRSNSGRSATRLRARLGHSVDPRRRPGSTSDVRRRDKVSGNSTRLSTRSRGTSRSSRTSGRFPDRAVPLPYHGRTVRRQRWQREDQVTYWMPRVEVIASPRAGDD